MEEGLACECYWEDWYQEVHREKIVTAKKEHECCECKEPIKPGEQYEDIFIVWNDYDESWPTTYKTCLQCKRVRDDLFEQGYCLYYGFLWEHIKNEEKWLDEEHEMFGEEALRPA